MNSQHILDTGVLLALGTPSNDRYRRFRRFALRNDVTFVVPERVYDELSEAVISDTVSEDSVPVDTAIEAGWVRVGPPLEYTIPLVSNTMDGIRRYIANADDRPADEIEQADLALGALAAQLLYTDAAQRIVIYTTDRAAGEGATAVLQREGFGDAIRIVDGFAFIEELVTDE